MKILFSPSEKKLTHHPAQIPSKNDFYQDLIAKDSLKNIITQYEGYLKKSTDSTIQKLFGKKTLSLEVLGLCQNLSTSPLLSAILRYCGTAYEALDFETLKKSQQDYLQEKVLIFSNLFGLLRPYDKIPYYDLMQGEGFLDFETKKFYKAHQEQFLGFLEGEILDLRAGFYQKCLTLGNDFQVYEPVFIKEGKTVSHYAKYYRGILLRECAKSKIPNSKALFKLKIQGLSHPRIQNLNNTKIRIFYEVLN